MKGDPSKGLLAEIISVIHECGDDQVHNVNDITEKIKIRGWWNDKQAQTPARTVNSYFSKNNEFFERVKPNHYRLRQEYWDTQIDSPVIYDIACPACGIILEVSKEHLGMRGQCQECLHKFIITLGEQDPKSICIEEKDNQAEDKQVSITDCRDVKTPLVSCKTDGSETDSIFSVPDKYIDVYELISKYYPDLRSCSAVCAISPDHFSSFRGVGIIKVMKLVKWQSEIVINRSGYNVDKDSIAQLKDYKLSDFYLSRDARKLLSKYERMGNSYDELTPLFIVNQSPSSVINMKGFGKKSAMTLRILQSEIMDVLDSCKSDGILTPVRFGDSLPLSDIGIHIAEDLERFHKHLSNEERLIWRHRAGYKTKRLTLQELGDKLSVTRERIRQRFEMLNTILCRGMRVNPDILLYSLMNADSDHVLGELTALRKIFCDDASMLKILASISGSDYRLLSERCSISESNKPSQKNHDPVDKGLASDILEEIFAL